MNCVDMSVGQIEANQVLGEINRFDHVIYLQTGASE